MIIDTHAHYDDEAFDTDREALLMSRHYDDDSLGHGFRKRFMSMYEEGLRRL